MFSSPNPPRSDTATNGPIYFTTSPDGHMSLFAVDGQTVRHIGTFTDIAAVWEAMDELDKAA